MPTVVEKSHADCSVVTAITAMDIASVPVPTEIGHADGTHGMAETGTDAMSIAVFAVTTEKSTWLFSTGVGVGTYMRPSTRAQDPRSPAGLL